MASSSPKLTPFHGSSTTTAPPPPAPPPPPPAPPHASTALAPAVTALDKPTLSGGLGIQHGHFVDHHGRVQILHGVNLGGSSKMPSGYAHKDPLPQGIAAFFDAAPHVSFVDRPFPLQDADLHFKRLRRWGLTFLRLIVTWEGIEHAGPGQYDRAYLEYVRALVAKAAQYGLQVYVDPHQDTWSRWTGGDGAPLWTLEAIGLEPRHFEATKAAICMETMTPSLGSAAQYPKMIWPTNYFKYACATMFTLFWGGHRFAPQLIVDGMPVQDFLQSHYINAMVELARGLRGLTNVVGFGPMNEPSPGFIGVPDLRQRFCTTELKYELAPTPFQGMCLADGLPQRVGSWSNGIRQHVFGWPDRVVEVDPHGQRAWKLSHPELWQASGVWERDAQGHPQLLQPHYFANVEFGRECYVPFAKRFTEAIRRELPHTMLFVELPPVEFNNSEFPDLPPEQLPRAINATHWYDGVTLFLQQWRPWFSVDPTTKWPAFGRHAVRAMHLGQLREIQDYGRVHMHGAPTLIGETGIPFNMNHGRAFRDGNYAQQVDALDHTLNCMETLLLSYTLWCYTSDNAHGFGDLWNGEDLSIVCEDDVAQRQQRLRRQSANESMSSGGEGMYQSLGTTKSNREPSTTVTEAKEAVDGQHPSEGDAAARALLAFARPHATKVAGIPTHSRFDRHTRRYVLEYDAHKAAPSQWSHSTGGGDGDVASKYPKHATTEIHVPHCQYSTAGYTVTLSDGEYDVQSHDGYDTVLVHHDEREPRHRVELTSRDMALAESRRARQRRQYATAAATAFAAVVLLVYFATK